MSAKDQMDFVLKILKNNAWFIVLATLASVFIYPVVFYRNYISPMLNNEAMLAPDAYFAQLQFGGMFIYAFALVVAIAVFAYLFKKSGSDFFHSLAIKRSKLLFLNFISGCLVLLIPITIGYGMLIVRTIPVLSQRTATLTVEHFLGMLLLSYLFTAVMLVLVLTVVMYCATYAGNTISTFVVFYTVFISPFLIVLSCYLLVERFLLGFAKPVNYGKPLQLFDQILQPKEIIVAIIIILIATAMMYLFANLSYKKRPSEIVSKMLSSRWMKNLFFYGSLFVASSFTLYVFDSITIVLAVVVSMVLFVVITAVLEQDLASAFTKKSIVKLLSFVGVMGAILLLLWSGVFGNKDVPVASEIEAVVVSDLFGQLNLPSGRNMANNVDNLVCTDPETIQIVVEMHENIISEISYPVGSTGTNGNNVVITYYLADGDTKTYMYNFEDISDKSMMSEFVNTKENKENLFFFIEDENYTIQSVSVRDYSGDMDVDSSMVDYESIRSLFEQPDVAVGLAEAVKTDVMNDPILTVQSFNLDVIHDEEPAPEGIVCSIQFWGMNEVTGEEFDAEFLIKDTYTNTLEYMDKTMEENLGYGLENYE